MKWKIKGDYLVIRIPLSEMSGAILEAETAEWNKAGEPPKVRKPSKPKQPVPIEHTPECVQRRAQEFVFTKQWPVHCRTCNARGYIVNNATKQKVTCPRCIEVGICSRCGISALNKRSDEGGTYVVCNTCEWSQRNAFDGSAEAAGLVAPVWRCECSDAAD